MLKLRFLSLLFLPCRSSVRQTLSAFSLVHHFHSSRDDASSPKSIHRNPKNPVIFNYLVDSFGIPKSHAISISDHYSCSRNVEQLQSVVRFLKNSGFLDAHIRTIVHSAPRVLFTGNVDKTLKPKLQFFQELGFSVPHLVQVISKNPCILSSDLDQRLKPFFKIVKKILVHDEENRYLSRVLRRCSWIAFSAPEERLIPNVAYLESCGIVGPQLSSLLVNRSWIFTMRSSDLRELVSRALDMGFVINSPKLAYALSALMCMSKETLSRKFELVRSFGYSDDECLQMLRNMPLVFAASEKQLKLGMEFYLNTINMKRSSLVSNPALLKYSLKDRVIPRYRVLQVLKMKGLLKKEPSFASAVKVEEKRFLEKYISRYGEHANQLLAAFKGNSLASLDG